jgi:hypothetical protein
VIPSLSEDASVLQDAVKRLKRVPEDNVLEKGETIFCPQTTKGKLPDSESQERGSVEPAQQTIDGHQAPPGRECASIVRIPWWWYTSLKEQSEGGL